MKIWTVLLAVALAVGAADADAARRLGGGGSFGRQSPNVTQRQATPPAPAAPTAPANAQRAPGTAGAAAAPQPRSRWGGMLGGLAAGLGLAALAHALGFGPAFGSVMLVVLLALLAMTAIAMLRRRAQPAAAAAAAAAGPYQHSGLSADDPLSPRQYNPQKVGNDASARPWESGYDATHAQDAADGLRIGSALRGSPEPAPGEPAWGIPAGFDTAAFLAAAKHNFVALQDAWDRADVGALRGMMTDEMLHEIRGQLAERDRQPGPVQKTGVDLLEAQLLGIQDLPGEYMASVEFSGMIREDPSAGPAPFREVWNMTKPRDGSSGWLVAGVQALQ